MAELLRGAHRACAGMSRVWDTLPSLRASVQHKRGCRMLAYLHWPTTLQVYFAAANKHCKVFRKLVGLVEDFPNRWCFQIWPILPLSPTLIPPFAVSLKDTQFSLKLLNKVLLVLTQEMLDFSLCFLCLGNVFFHFWRAERHKTAMSPVTECSHPPVKHPVPFPVGTRTVVHVTVLHIASLLVMSSRDRANTSEQQQRSDISKALKED